MYFINKITSHPTVDFAAEELKKYLRMMMPEGGDVEIFYAPEALDGFRVGLMADLGLDTSDVRDPSVNDIIYIDTDCLGGIVAGSNAAATLIAVYEYLRQLGCRWLFPGEDGEYIPIRELSPVKHRFVPSCLCRAFCWESGVSHRSTLDMIDFAPKVGMNSFMLEHNDATWYHEHFYHHIMNEENRPAERITKDTVAQWKRAAEVEIARRGMKFHNIGHGFTIEPFADGSLDKKRFLAEIDGVRDYHNGAPVYTNICLSNAEARSKAVDYIIEFTKRHSNTDYMHVWLADGSNNHCECEECRKMNPSDFYVMLMNELDRAMSKAGLNKKVVIAVYLDTMWPPENLTFNNPDRFMLMFAPISRSYTATIHEDGGIQELKPYVRNKLEFPKSLEENLGYLERWRSVTGSEMIAFEYHFWRHFALDPSGIFLSRRISEDVKAYRENGINGIIEDGTLRGFFPTGIALYTYARTMYDTSLSAEDIAREYFECAFGEDWREFYSYLERVGEQFDFAYLEGERSTKPQFSSYYNPSHLSSLERISETADEGMKLIKSHYDSSYRVRTVSVRLLEYHNEYIRMLSEALCKKAVGDEDGAAELYTRLRVEFGKREIYIERYYDHLGIMFGLSNVFKKGNVNQEPIIDFTPMHIEQSTDVYATIQSIINVMEKQYGDPELRAGELLRQSGFSDDYIRSKFYEVTKKTPVKYLNHIRIKNARIRLLSTDISVNEVAHKCGFLDMSYFSRMFKAEYGVTPTKLKKNEKYCSVSISGVGKD